MTLNNTQIANSTSKLDDSALNTTFNHHATIKALAEPSILEGTAVNLDSMVSLKATE